MLVGLRRPWTEKGSCLAWGGECGCRELVGLGLEFGIGVYNVISKETYLPWLRRTTFLTSNLMLLVCTVKRYLRTGARELFVS